MKTLSSTVKTEHTTIAKLRQSKKSIEAEIEDLAGRVESLHEDVVSVKTQLDEKTRALEEVKKANGKATRALDAVTKEIASMVGTLTLAIFAFTDPTPANQNDEIEKLGSERFLIYRKCKLEEIDLPLEAGDLNDVPLEEVSLAVFIVPALSHPSDQNPENMAMDVDGDDDGAQRPREVESYGLEVDFETLEAEDREVRSGRLCYLLSHSYEQESNRLDRMALKRVERSWTQTSRRSSATSNTLRRT